MISDGFVTFTGNWHGYQAYIHHPAINPVLRRFAAELFEEEARVRLVFDLMERKARIGAIQETEHLLARQLKKKVKRNRSPAYKDLDFLIRCFLDQPLRGSQAIMSHCSTFAVLKNRKAQPVVRIGPFGGCSVYLGAVLEGRK
jgi:hypothetical protein